MEYIANLKAKTMQTKYIIVTPPEHSYIRHTEELNHTRALTKDNTFRKCFNKAITFETKEEAELKIQERFNDGVYGYLYIIEVYNRHF